VPIAEIGGLKNLTFFENFAPPFPEKEVRNGPASRKAEENFSSVGCFENFR